MKICEWSGTENELESITNLTSKIYKNSDSSDPKYIDWFFKKNPYGKSVVFLAKDMESNSIIGIEPITPMALMVNGKTIRGSLSSNSAVDSNYRGKGIFSQMLNFLSKGAEENKIDCIYGVANDQSFHIFLNHGFISLGKLPLLIKPQKISNYFPKTLSYFFKPLDYFWKSPIISDSSITSSMTFTKEFDELSRKASKRFNVIQKRNKDFLNWRYNDHPTRKYKIFTINHNSDLQGYIITRITRINNKLVGIILDFLVDSDVDNKRLCNLVNYALNYFRINNVSAVISTAPKNSLEYKLLRQVGFFSIPDIWRPAPFHFIVNPLNLESRDAAKLTKFENWYFSFGDFDTF